MDSQTETQAKFSIPSIIAIICAVASFPTGAILGLVLAAVAVIFGIIGIALAFSEKVRGGIVSTLAVLGGGLGLMAAIIKAVAYFF